MKPVVYLADLTHENPLGLGSDTMPLQIGLLGSYLLKTLGDRVEVELFKFLGPLLEAVAARPPLVLGLSNYVWNIDLASRVAEAVKARHPATAIVFGGPNYPTDEAEQVAWLRARPFVDFYVYRDGEIVFADLVAALLEADVIGATGPAEAIEAVQRQRLPSCHALVAGEPSFGPVAERLADLGAVPSPYAGGLMDKFFQHRLIPAMRTNRGCPFTCTFCAEGDPYYTRIHRVPAAQCRAEFDAIAARVRHTGILRIADSNFAMYVEDEAFVDHVAETKNRTGYPSYLNCATGKNCKDRVLACNEKLGGAMRLTSSVQSLDPTVLEYVSRNNISLDDIMALSDRTSDTDTHSYSEIILALPGDSLEAERRTMAGLVHAGISNITQHQLSLIPGTEMASPASRERFAMESMFRPIQRCIGVYDIFGTRTPSIEIEEICTATNTLSHADYLEARRLYLTLGLFYNDRVFGEVHALLRTLKQPTWGWLERIHDHLADAPEAVRAIYAGFTEETEAELWPSPEALWADVGARIDEYAAGTVGGNLIYKYRSAGLVRSFDTVQAMAFDHLRAYLDEQDLAETEAVAEAVDEVERFSHHRKRDLFDPTVTHDEVFGLDIPRMMTAVGESRAAESLECFRRPLRLRFAHTDAQRRALEEQLAFYGRDEGGLTMLLSRFPVKRFYRTPLELA